jgi:hypothetical protein
MKLIAALMLALALSQAQAQTVSEKFTLKTSVDGVVTFGAGTQVKTLAVKAGQTVACDSGTFGGDPAPGVVKTCTFKAAAKTMEPPRSFPSTLGGTGGPLLRYVSISVTGLEAWIAWRNPDGTANVYICRNSGCLPGAPILPVTDPQFADLYRAAMAATK